MTPKRGHILAVDELHVHRQSFFRLLFHTAHRQNTYLHVPKFERKKKSNGNDVFADNSVGWHLATNSFHQHVRLLMEISPHTIIITQIQNYKMTFHFNDSTTLIKRTSSIFLLFY